MSYVDLGHFQFTTGADFTGFNVGNMTSVLSLSTIRVPYFELYRLAINTSQIPSSGNLPAIVQQTPIFSGSSLTSLTGAFPKAVTPGSLVVAGISLLDSADGPNGTVSAVTLGGSADHMGAVKTAVGGDTGPSSFLWADPSAQEASTALAVTMTGGSGTNLAAGQGFEISGMLATSSAAACVDVTGNAVVNTSSGTTSATTNAGGTTKANEMVIGFGMGSAGSSWTLAGGTNVTTAAYVGRPAAGYFCGAAGAWGQASVAGSPATFTMAVTGSAQDCYWGLVSAAFLPALTAGGASAFPFTVAIDGLTWDTEQTTPGVGYTYSTLGTNPLYLTGGQNLQIFWTGLPAATYLQYAQQFNITAWFRYDPAVQPPSSS